MSIVEIIQSDKKVYNKSGEEIPTRIEFIPNGVMEVVRSHSVSYQYAKKMYEELELYKR